MPFSHVVIELGSYTSRTVFFANSGTTMADTDVTLKSMQSFSFSAHVKGLLVADANNVRGSTLDDPEKAARFIKGESQPFVADLRASWKTTIKAFFVDYKVQGDPEAMAEESLCFGLKAISISAVAAGTETIAVAVGNTASMIANAVLTFYYSSFPPISKEAIVARMDGAPPPRSKRTTTRTSHPLIANLRS